MTITNSEKKIFIKHTLQIIAIAAIFFLPVCAIYHYNTKPKPPEPTMVVIEMVYNRGQFVGEIVQYKDGTKYFIGRGGAVKLDE